MTGNNHVWLLEKAWLLLILAGLASGCAAPASVTGYVSEGTVSSSSIAIDPAGHLPDNFRPLEQVRITATLVGDEGREVATDIYTSGSDGGFTIRVPGQSWPNRLLDRKLSYRLLLQKTGYESVTKYVSLPLAEGEMLFCLLKPAPALPP